MDKDQQTPQDTEGPHLKDVEALIIHHTDLPQTAISRSLDGLVAGIGKSLSWLWLAVVAVILVSVISRYVFGAGSVMLEEIQWHIAGAVWLIGIAYTLVTDDHVRVDVLHESLSLRTKAWIELFGILLLLIPFSVIAFTEALPYFLSALEQNERSQAPGGLPARWFLKFFLPACFGLIALAALSRLLKCTALLFGKPSPARRDAAESE